MKLSERIRRWWKPGEYDDHRGVTHDDHPLSLEERDEERPLSFDDERGKIESHGVGGDVFDPDDDRPPR